MIEEPGGLQFMGLQRGRHDYTIPICKLERISNLSCYYLKERERRKEGDAFKSVYADSCSGEIILPF